MPRPKKKIETRGGKRANAGRPATGVKQTYVKRLTPQEWAIIQAERGIEASKE